MQSRLFQSGGERQDEKQKTLFVIVVALKVVKTGFHRKLAAKFSNVLFPSSEKSPLSLSGFINEDDATWDKGVA